MRRTIEKHREQVLRCDSVLQKNPFVNAVPSSSLKKGKKKKNKVLDATVDVANKVSLFTLFSFFTVFFFHFWFVSYLCSWAYLVFQGGVTYVLGMVDIWENENAGEGDIKSKKVLIFSIIIASLINCAF